MKDAHRHATIKTLTVRARETLEWLTPRRMRPARSLTEAVTSETETVDSWNDPSEADVWKTVLSRQTR